MTSLYKLLPLLLCFLGHTPTVLSQNTCLLRLGGGYFDFQYGQSALSTTGSGKRAFSLSNTVEIMAQRKLKTNHRIGIGIMYERTTYLQKNIPIIDFTSSFIVDPPRTYGDSKSVFHSLLTPFYFHFYWGKNKRFFVGPSVAQRFLLLSSNKTSFTSPEGVQLFQKQSFIGFNLSAAVGLEGGCELQLKNGDALQITAFAKTYLQRATFAFNYYTYFYGLGVGYNFLKWFKK